MKNQIPGLFRKLFEWFCDSQLFEELQGDLEEAFNENVEELGLKKARSIYRVEVLKMIRPSILKHFQFINKNIMTLPKNYLKTSLRSIKLHPFYVFANVFGLALAISICTIGYFNYRFNATFNEHFDQAKNLYKVHGERIGESTVGSSSLALAPALRAAGIEAMRYHGGNLSLKDGERLFSSYIAFSDKEFLNYFTFSNLDNGKITAPDINEIVLSKELALKLFNEPYPVGELVEIVFPNKEERSFVVADVYQKPPTNTSFFQSAFLSFEVYIDVFNIEKDDWSKDINGTFIYAKQQELSRVSSQIASFLPIRNTNNPSLNISEYRLDTILEWPAIENHLYNGEFNHHLHPSSVIGIAGSALSILLLACFNFINTSIALSGKRLKEIAVRKIMGGNRKSTMTQFLIENSFMISIAVVLSFGISYLLVPGYNAMFQRELIQLDKVPILTLVEFGIALILIVTLLSAAYPSLYVSRFSSLLIFRNKVILSGKNRLMAVLLTFQFALCFYNIFSMFINIDNSRYQETLDRGYDLDPVVNVFLNRPEQFQVFANELRKEQEVEGVAGTTNMIGFSREQEFLQFDGLDYSVSVIQVGESYPQLMGLRLIKGSFSGTLGNNQDMVVINRMLEKQFGDLLNKQITIEGNKYKVMGVVEDFNLRNIMMDNKIMPTVIKYAPESTFSIASVRVAGLSEEMDKTIEKVWYQLFPNELYRSMLQKEVMSSARETNQVFIKINAFLAIITVLISTLGLFTLISLKVQKRSKEFGIRKVLGASRGVIVHLLGKDLYWMIGIAGIIGLTASTLIIESVFDVVYAYHVSVNTGHFLKATLVVFLIVVSTVGYKVYQTSRINPSQQLRME